MNHFKPYSKHDILSRTRLRKFETKVGEAIRFCEEADIETSIQNSDAQYVLFGISEDIGIRANYGIGGAAGLWNAFLPSFLNVQCNDFFEGREVLLAGWFDFEPMWDIISKNAADNDEQIAALRQAVNVIDTEVEHLVNIIARNKKIPIAVGGGHNNAYPLIKGAAKGLHKAGLIPLAQVSAVNLDAHTDFRPSEGRHSGNAFRYADEDGFLDKYFIIGAHENYLPQNIWMDIVNDPFVDMISFEDIFVRGKCSFQNAIQSAASFVAGNFCGIELDADAIGGTLSSAYTPCGILPVHARQYISIMAEKTDVAYLHITEAAVALNDGREDPSVAKLIAYLVTDFIKSVNLK